jgi:hypothetical protein
VLKRCPCTSEGGMRRLLEFYKVRNFPTVSGLRFSTRPHQQENFIANLSPQCKARCIRFRYMTHKVDLSLNNAIHPSHRSVGCPLSASHTRSQAMKPDDDLALICVLRSKYTAPCCLSKLLETTCCMPLRKGDSVLLLLVRLHQPSDVPQRCRLVVSI